jgi:hypothetical protein
MAIKSVSAKSGAKSPPKTVGFTNPILGQEVIPTQASLAPPENYGYLEGDWGVSDLKIAQLCLKHAVDTRFADVTPGHYVYSRNMEDYFSLVPPIPVIFLKAHKRYLHEVEPGEIPLICDTKQEVIELGGVVGQERPDLTPFEPFCDCLVLIGEAARSEWPDTPLFDVGETRRALAAYRMKGSAYKEVGSVLANRSAYLKIMKKEPELIWAQEWHLSSTLRKLPSFSYQIPTLVRLRAVSAAELLALEELAKNL